MSTTYRIDKHGAFHSSNDIYNLGDIILKLMNSERVRHGIKIAYEIFDVSSFKIAGGFLRDTVCEKPVKDLDIFTENRLLFPDYKIQPSYGNGSVLSTRIIEHGGEQVNLCLVPDLKNLVNKFPLNISKIAYHSDGLFQVTYDFMTDVNLKTLTQGDPLYANEDYFERIKQKYSDFSFRRGTSPIDGIPFF